MQDHLPQGASLLISVTNSAGDPVLTHHRVELLSIGDRYITGPLDFVAGQYIVTEFMIVQDSSEVLFAAPQRGSTLAAAVIKSLPFNFNVRRNQLSTIAVEVVDATVSQPEDFGYASFDINIVYPLRVAVFVVDENGLSITDAEATLYINYGNGEWFYSYPIYPVINTLPICRNPDFVHKLFISKPGYKLYSKELSYNSIVAELGDRPLKVFLEPEE